MNAALILLIALPCADWDRFRGPDGTGVSDEKGIPSLWKPENVLWKAPLPGGGHSSPIVVGGKVFLQTATDKERHLVCLDAASGKLLWKKGIAGRKGHTHAKSSLASSTPCSDGERVYIVFWDGDAVALHAYTLAGEPAWHKPLGKFTSQHGPGFSPVLAAGKVIVNNDQDKKAELLAFDARTGEPAWRVERKGHRACYSTPFLHGGQLLVTTTTGLTGYDPAQGKELWNYVWSFPDMPLRTVASSIVHEGLLFACSGDGRGDRNMVAIRLGGKGDLTRTAKAWQLGKGTPYVPSILARGSHLYTVNDEGVAVCRDAKTGEEAWKQRLGSSVSASPVLVEGRMFVFGEKGDVTVLDAKPDAARVLATNKVGEPVLSSPAVANGRMYVRGSKHLLCIGTPKE